MVEARKEGRLNEGLDDVRLFRQFLEMQGVIAAWHRGLPALRIDELVPDEEATERTTVFVVDMINDFCKPDGALYSPRIEGIIPAIVELIKKANRSRVRTIRIQDAHSPDAKEFKVFPRHAVRGTEGAKTIKEIMTLPFSAEFLLVEKNSLSPFPSTHVFHERGAAHRFTPYLHEIFSGNNGIAVLAGDCTNLCVEQTAMGLKLWANEYGKAMRVVIPVNCVQTFDLPFGTAAELGAMPHPGDMQHIFALYEMARNGIEIVREIM